MGFQGVYYNSIDAKGRASIPARFREQLKELFGADVLVVTQDRCGIVAYPVSEWDSFLEKFAQLPNGQFREDLYFTTVTPQRTVRSTSRAGFSYRNPCVNIVSLIRTVCVTLLSSAEPKKSKFSTKHDISKCSPKQSSVRLRIGRSVSIWDFSFGCERVQACVGDGR